MRSALGLLIALLAITTVLEGDASAARRHRRNHRRGPLICPSDTQAINGRCIPILPPGPPADPIGNVKIAPSTATLTMTGSTPPVGSFNQANVVATGLPPSAVVTLSAPGLSSACAPGSGQVNLVTPNDANGSLTFNIAGLSCPPGSYAINFTETAAPFQTFTAFIKLHF